MRLKRTAEHDFTTNFDILDANGNWVEGFTGKFAPIDRFLSNFHRPMQRRMLYSSPDENLPATRVIRNTITKEVYILGQSRLDEEFGENYAKLTVAQLVSNKSSGLATVTRKIVDTGRPSITIGELIDSTVGTYYVTVEYKSSIEAFGADEVFEDRFVIFTPSDIALEAEDVITLNGVDYVVNTPYIDSDFTSAITTREPDDRLTGTYRQATYAYSTVTGISTPTYTDYLVTCTVTTEKVRTNAQGVSNDAEVYLKSPAFPITPKVGDRFNVSGDKYVIRSVVRSQEANYQWLLKCDWAIL